MKVKIEWIDREGFLHFKVGKSIGLVKEMITHLKEGTGVTWLGKNHVHISQQYLKPQRG